MDIQDAKCRKGKWREINHSIHQLLDYFTGCLVFDDEQKDSYGDIELRVPQAVLPRQAWRKGT